MYTSPILIKSKNDDAFAMFLNGINLEITNVIHNQLFLRRFISNRPKIYDDSKLCFLSQLNHLKSLYLRKIGH